MSMEPEEVIVAFTLGIVGVVFFVGILTLMAFPRYNTTRAGQHTGHITAVEQKGMFFHNYTVYVKTSESSSQEDTYCVHENNKDLADWLRAYSMSRETVVITFEGVRGWGLSLCSGEEITSVEGLRR